MVLAKAYDIIIAQAIIVRTPQSRDDLLKTHPELRRATILTVPESKGLEMDDVLLFDFFRDSPARQVAWLI